MICECYETHTCNVPLSDCLCTMRRALRDPERWIAICLPESYAQAVKYAGSIGKILQDILRHSPQDTHIASPEVWKDDPALNTATIYVEHSENPRECGVIVTEPSSNEELVFGCKVVSEGTTEVVPWKLLQMMLELCPKKQLLTCMREHHELFWKAFISAGHDHTGVKALRHASWDVRPEAPYGTTALGIVCTLRVYNFQEYTPNVEHVSEAWVTEEVSPVLDYILQVLNTLDPETAMRVYTERQVYTPDNLSHNTGEYSPFVYGYERMTFMQMLIATLGDERYAPAFDYCACEELLCSVEKHLTDPVLRSQVYTGTVDAYIRAHRSKCCTTDDDTRMIDILLSLMEKEHQMPHRLLQTFYAVIGDNTSFYSDDETDDKVGISKDQFEYDPEYPAAGIRKTQIDMLVQFGIPEPVARASIDKHTAVQEPYHRARLRQYDEDRFAYRTATHVWANVVDELNTDASVNTERLVEFDKAMRLHLECAIKHHRPEYVSTLVDMFPHLLKEDVVWERTAEHTAVNDDNVWKRANTHANDFEKHTLFKQSVKSFITCHLRLPGFEVSPPEHQDAARSIMETLASKDFVNVNQPYVNTGQTVLHMLMQMWKYRVQRLRSYNPYKMPSMLSPTMLLYVEVLRMLLAMGCDPNVADNEQMTARQLATEVLHDLNDLRNHCHSKMLPLMKDKTDRCSLQVALDTAASLYTPYLEEIARVTCDDTGHHETSSKKRKTASSLNASSSQS